VIPRRLVVNLIVFFALSAALVLFGVVDLLGSPLAHKTDVSSVFPNASGLFANTSVELDGVDVGTVTAVSLSTSGANVAMAINPGVTVPGDVTASIDIANDLGEQVVELTPGHARGDPPLADGAVIPTSKHSIPVSVGQVVGAAVRMLRAIPPGKLNSLLSTLATALNGQAGHLREFISASSDFSKEFLAYQRQFEALLHNAPPLLNAVSAVGPQLRQDLENTQVLMAVVAQDRGDLAPLFSNGAEAFALLGKLVTDESPNLGCLLHDASHVTANLAEPANLANLSTGLATNQYFFGAINNSLQPGPTKALSNSVGASANQIFARTRLLLPPGQPSAIAYGSSATLNPIEPGAACDTEFGKGVGAASQSGFTPAAGGHVVPPGPTDAEVRGGGDPPPAAHTTSATSTAADDVRTPASVWMLAPIGVVLLVGFALAWARPPRYAGGRRVERRRRYR